ncbi:MAG: HD domain-containing protein [Acidimicrobiia bacterium]
MAAGSVDEVVALYERWGTVFYDDAVTQLDHGLQCAALASRDGARDSLIAAALLHDIGHLLELEQNEGRIGDLGIDRDHEARGARYLAALFEADVTAPIALHVRAKRYLCAVDPAYAAELSDGSVRSLTTQGGPLSTEEVAVFEAHPSWCAAVQVRRWDDRGKVDGMAVPPLSEYVDLLERLRRHAT